MAEYNTTRPHQSLGMATPADRFSSARAQAEEKLLPVRLPAVLALSAAPHASTAPAGQPGEPAAEPATAAAVPVYDGGPVEFERVVPASGNMQAARRQFWPGPDRSGLTVTFWASTEVIHLLIAGARIKTVRSHLSAADLTALASTGPARPGRRPCLPPSRVRRSRWTGSSAKTAPSTWPIVTFWPRRSPAAAVSASGSRKPP